MRTEKSKKIALCEKGWGKSLGGWCNEWCITLQVLGRAGLGEGGGLKIHGPFFSPI